MPSIIFAKGHYPCFTCASNGIPSYHTYSFAKKRCALITDSFVKDYSSSNLDIST